MHGKRGSRTSQDEMDDMTRTFAMDGNESFGGTTHTAGLATKYEFKRL